MMIVIMTAAGETDEAQDGPRRRRAAAPARLQRHRLSRGDRAHRRAARLDLPPLPGRQGPARGRGGRLRRRPRARRDRGAVRRRRPDRRPARLRRALARATSSAPATAPAARSPPSRSRTTTRRRSCSTPPRAPSSSGESRSPTACAAPGWPRARSSRLAVLVVSAVEGAIVLSRAERDPAPLLDVAARARARDRGGAGARAWPRATPSRPTTPTGTGTPATGAQTPDRGDDRGRARRRALRGQRRRRGGVLQAGPRGRDRGRAVGDDARSAAGAPTAGDLWGSPSPCRSTTTRWMRRWRC